MTAPIPGLRQFQADFQTGTEGYEGTSSTRRPDAVTPDYRWAAAYGPIHIADVSAGVRDRPWYVVLSGLTVRIARANDANTAWEAESELFAYTGPLIDEMGLAFDQSGRPVIAAERATGAGGSPEVWIYRFDAVLGFTFGSFGPGRNARAILDAPDFTSDSDVLAFYVNPVADRVEMRVQRENYAVGNAVPVTSVTNRFIEGVLKISDGRIRVSGTERDPLTGTYSQWSLESALYPIRVGDSTDAGIVFDGAGLVTVVLVVAQTTADRWAAESTDASLAFDGAALTDAVIVINQTTDDRWAPESTDASLVFDGAALDVVVIVVNQTSTQRWAAESTDASLAFVAAALDTVVIVINQSTATRIPGLPESMDASLAFVGATLEVA